MIKIKYKGTKIETDSIDEAINILESLKDTKPYYYPYYPYWPTSPIYPTYEQPSWMIHCSDSCSLTYKENSSDLTNTNNSSEKTESKFL